MNPRHYIIQEVGSDRIRVTDQGVEAFGKRFARIGLDITQIQTGSELNKALDRLFAFEIRNLAFRYKDSAGSSDDQDTFHADGCLNECD